jgi:recombinational DNA repair ATPase RecF
MRLLVHINQVELTHFKSFGGSISIPLEQGFSVVTGPNGSGKSNILDAVLFCLGLASSRGMRAERLPDLVNSAMLKEGHRHYSGLEEAVYKNIDACKQLAAIVKTSMGPNGKERKRKKVRRRSLCLLNIVAQRKVFWHPSFLKLAKLYVLAYPDSI